MPCGYLYQCGGSFAQAYSENELEQADASAPGATHSKLGDHRHVCAGADPCCCHICGCRTA